MPILTTCTESNEPAVPNDCERRTPRHEFLVALVAPLPGDMPARQETAADPPGWRPRPPPRARRKRFAGDFP